jgi:Na+/melibiose symporter-like transporter
MKKILKNNKITMHIVYFTLGTIIMFHAYFFVDKELSLNTLIEHKNDFMMYLCIIFSFLTVLAIYYVIGGFKKNVSRVEKKERGNLKTNYPDFKFFSKKRFYFFLIFNLGLITFVVFYGVYVVILPYFFNKLVQGKSELAMIISIVIAVGCSIFINYRIGFFCKENIKKITSTKENEELDKVDYEN